MISSEYIGMTSKVMSVTKALSEYLAELKMETPRCSAEGLRISRLIPYLVEQGFTVSMSFDLSGSQWTIMHPHGITDIERTIFHRMMEIETKLFEEGAVALSFDPDKAEETIKHLPE